MTPFIDLIRIISRKDERQMDKGKKGQRDKKTKEQYKTKRPKIELNIVLSGQFCTLAMV